MRNSILIAAAAAILAVPAAASAQNTADVTATANVLTPITVTNIADLDFGDVLPGIATTVAPADVDAGRFQISGSGVSEVQLAFTLPTELDHATSASTLPLSFGGSSAGLGTLGIIASTFDPAAGLTTNLSAISPLDVFIGGTVTPTVTQEAGAYSGTITLTVTYTGS
jgi:spore coat protein U-like protein